MAEIETKEIAVLKCQVSKLENQANQIIITTPEENAIATDLKAKLKETGNTIKARKEAITKPLNAALKSARELFAPIEAQFEIAENIVGRKLIAYKQKVEAEARAREKKIADDLEAERIRLAKEVEAGKITEEAAEKKFDNKLEKAETKVENLKRVEKTTQTKHGQVQFRKIAKMRITNESLIPDEYWVIDMVKLRADVVKGIVVPGAERYEEEVV